MRDQLVRLAQKVGLHAWARRMKMRAYRVLPERVRDDADAVRFYRGLFGPGDLVFDVGANVGIKVKTFRGVGARVVAVEPQPPALERLTAVFGSDPDVVIVPMAVGRSAGTATLHQAQRQSGLSTMSERWVSSGRYSGSESWRPVTVQTTTLDALIDEYGLPRFIKIDVEGYESEVLAGLTRPVPVVSFEFHGELLDVAERCVDLVAALGSYEFDLVFEGEAADLGRWRGPDQVKRDLAAAGSSAQGEVYARSLD